MAHFHTCRFCKGADAEGMVHYGRRHWAHYACYLDAGKKLADLVPWQVSKFPYKLLKERGLLDEACAIVDSETAQPHRPALQRPADWACEVA